MNKLLLVLTLTVLGVVSTFAQIDYFNVDGSWAGNDANGNAVIKWRITICAGPMGDSAVVVRVPSIERDETQSGGVGIADEDSPADDQVCSGAWNSNFNNFRPTDYQTTGILLDMGTTRFPNNACRIYSWTSYSKDYDSSADDYDHYVTANYSTATLPDPGFDCGSLNGSDGFISCDDGNTNNGTAICMDQIDCDDVATNNYEQILGLAYDKVDGPNFSPDCNDGDYAFDMTWNYVVCHHGESDYEAGCDKTVPGETGAVDIIPDSVTNVIINNNFIQRLESRGATVTNFTLTNPGTNQFLIVNPGWDGNGTQAMTLPESTLPPGIDEMLDGNEPATSSTSCMDSQPACDTLELYIEWRPNDLTDMFNSGNEGFNCDETGNINTGNAAGTNNLFNYWHQPSLGSYVPVMGYQNPGTAGAPEGPPTEVAHVGLNPDPEFGDCNNSAFNTCSAGPAEDCSGRGVQMGYYSEIMLTKNTLSVEPNFSNPNYFDVTFEIIFTNEGEVNLINPTLVDDLVMTFDNNPAAYILPFATPPTIDATVVPAPSVPGGGFPTLNGMYNGNGDTEIFNGNGGVIEPGESVRITFEVTVDRSVLGDDEYTNQAQVNAPDCFGMMSSDIWCVGDADESMLQLFSIDVALAKTTITPGPYTLGQTVTFNIEVINQGTADLQNVEVTDYIPCGFAYAPSNNPLWSLNGNQATTDILSLPMGTSENVTIDLIVQNCSDPGAWTNVAEVSYMEDEFGRDVSMIDFDSMADNNPTDDAGGAPNTGSDDSVGGDGMGDPGDTDPATDEDDSDPEQIDIFDLALDKVITSTPPFNYGDLIEFTITVYNQGNMPVTDVDITDYMPDGYSFDEDDNTGWSEVGPYLEYTIDGPLNPGASEEVTLFLMLEQGTDGDSWYNEAEISSFADENGNPAVDWDSNPNDNPDDDNDVVIDSDDDNEINENGGPGEDEDDNDPAEPEIVDAALIKTTSDPGPYSYGDTITFDIAVTNQGNVTLTDIQVIEYLPCGYLFNGGNVSWGVLGDNYSTTINGPVVAGETVIVTMDVIIQACDEEDAYLNIAEIYGMSGPTGNPVVDIDSSPNTMPGDDPGGEPNGPTDDVTDNSGGDEDDHDPLLIDIFDAALVKSVSTPGPYSYGQTIVFDIEVFNQGNTTLTDITIYDDVPSGYSYDENAGVNPANGWSMGPNPSTTIAGPLAAGDSVTVQIEMVILANPGDDEAYINYAEISSMEDENSNIVPDADSTPDDNPTNDPGGEPGGNTDDTTGNENGDEDDQDPAVIEIFDLAIVKTPAEGGPFVYGDTVTYNITVINQGTVPADNIDVIDYLPCGLEFSTTNFPNWFFDAADNEAFTTIEEVLAPGADTTLIIDVVVVPCEGPDSYTNVTEIVDATDENGNPVDDVDSMPDDNPNDDAGGNVDDSTNDQTDGNGVDDEDDHDPAIIEIFDLALEKELATTPPYAYGDLLVFDITIENQGNVDATQIQVVDYIPAGYSYDPMEAINVANGWGPGPNPTTTIAGPLAPTEFATVSIALTFENTTGGADDWFNYAEIAQALDGDGNTPVDADSTPDDNPGNENDVEPGDPDDGNTDGNGPNAPNGPEDEDDHDPAGPTVVDMALAKTTDQQGPFDYGDIITYEIEVINQGNVTTNQIQVIDYIPSGLQFVGSNFPTWTFDPFSGNATAEINEDIAPGESVILTISLEVVPTTDFEDGWTNYAEIFGFEDSDGNNIADQDVDSDADATNGDDPGGEPDGTTDDVVDGDGTGPIGGGDPAGDEDDHDPEFIEIFDLALAKTLNTPAPYQYGQTVEFSFFVHNQGNVAATNVEITDYLPAGYSFDMTNPLNAGWTASGTDLTYTVTDLIAPADTAEVLLYLTIEMTDGGEQDWINYSEITAAQNEAGDDRTDWDIDSTPGSDGPGENAVEPGDAADDDVTSNDPGGEEDDHDPAGLEIFDLAQTKTTLETGPFVYGDEVLYTVTVYNQGSIEASSIEITDYLPCGLSYVASNDANGWDFDPATNYATVTLPGTLEPGESTTIDITLEVTQCIDTDASSFTNVTEISGSESEDPDEPADDIDSTEDDIPDNDGPFTDDEIEGDPNDPNNPDQDDSDPEVIEIFDLAQIKTLVTPGPYAYGDLLEFEFTVCNQGNVDAQSIEVTDYLPAGYSYSAAANTGWSEDGTDLVYAVPGILEADSCVNFTLFLTIEMTDGGETDWVNYSEITNADDDANPTNDPPVDADSTPGSDGPGENAIEPNETGDDDLDSVDPNGNEDDHDPAGIEVFDLAQIKTTDEMGPFAYGDELTYTITVYNQGSIEASAIEIVDYLPCGLAYTAVNNTTGWDYDATLDQATITIPGTLVPGDSVSVDIVLELQQCLDTDPESFTNVTEITGSESEDPDEPADDIDSTPDDIPDNDGPFTDNETDGDPSDPTNPDQDDSDPEVVEIFDLAQIKTLVTPGPYAYGDLLEFEFTVCNQGNVDAQGIEVTDYLPAGYSYSAAANSGWSEVGTDLVYAVPGILPEDECVSFTLFLTIEMTDGGETDWVNYSEITAADDDNDPTNEPPVDADSTPGSDTDAENAIEPNETGDDDLDSVDPDGNQDDHDPAGIEIFDLAQIKTTEATPPYAYGDVITYDITVYNQGSIEAGNIAITDYLPCGLAYAPSNNDDGWMYDATIDQATLVIPGTLLPGDSVTVQIDAILQQCIDMVPESFQNFTEISGAGSEDPDEPADDIDSTPDNIPDNDGPVTDDEINGDPSDPNNPDQDDHDPMLIEVFDLALIKSLVTPGPYAYGDLVEFEITVCNQGFVNAQSIEVTDYSPPGYSFDPANNTGWTTVGDNNVYQVPGILAADDCTTISLFLTIEQTGGGEQDWINYAEITAADDDNDPTNEPPIDADSTPGSDTDAENGIEPGDTGDDDLFSVDPDGNQDDHDPAGLEIFDLAQIKTTDETGPFSFGQEVTYTVTVFNQGSIAASSIEVTDYLPCGLSYITSNDANGWSFDPATSNATVTLPGSLEPGASTTVDIVLQIVPCYTDEAGAWTNVTEITGSESDDPDEPADDIDSTEDDIPDNDGPFTDNETDGDPNDPTNPDQDDSDPETIEIFDLALDKTIDDIGPYNEGEVATFDINVYNQGNVDAYNIVVTDYLNEGFIFDDAVNPGWSQAGDFVEYTIAGPLAPGEIEALVLNLEVAIPASATVNSWYNEAEISSADNDTDPDNAGPVDVDSTPNDNPDDDNDLVDGPDDDLIFDEDDDNDNVIDEDPSDPFGLGDDDEDDNDAAGISVVGGLGDTVWKDLDGDGIQDADEPGVEGVVVFLMDCEGNTLDVQVTNGDGFYFFNNLIPGDYQVRFDISGLPSGCAFTQQNVGDDLLDSDVNEFGLAPCTNIQGGEYDSTFDAGLLQLVNIGDFVWHDLDGDGAQDEGEPGIGGVEVLLYNEDNELIATTVTDENGYYLFEDVYPDRYYLVFVDPEGFDSTVADNTADDNDSDITNFIFTMEGSTTDLFTIEFGQEDDLTFDAGYFMCIPVGQLIWYDYYENNVKDPTENGLNGVPVIIYKLEDGGWVEYDETASGGNPDPSDPSGDGYWKFCVPPGTYYVEFEYPGALGDVQAVPNIGPNANLPLTNANESDLDSDLTNSNGVNTTPAFTVFSGNMHCNIGAGFYPEATIGNLVWNDENLNGMQDANEPRMAAVKVEAYTADGEKYAETYTDQEGEYRIHQLRQESYYLKFYPPTGYGATDANMASDDMDSDVTGTYGTNTTVLYSVNSGEDLHNVDAGLRAGVLPVEWKSVSAQWIGKSNEVRWATASELNADRYEVERRYETESEFVTIGSTAARGTATTAADYVYHDEDIRPGTYYYRVKQVDFDGVFEYSDVVTARVLADDDMVSLAPNPAAGSTKLTVSMQSASDIAIQIFTADGKLVRTHTLTSGANTATQGQIQIDDLPAGVYSVKVQQDDNTITKKLIMVR